jgi:hypothetical protein
LKPTEVGLRTRKRIRSCGTGFFLSALAAAAVAMIFFRQDALRILTRLSPDGNVSSPGLVFAGVLTYLSIGLLFWRAAAKPGRLPLDLHARIVLGAVLTIFFVFHLQTVVPMLRPLAAEDGLFESLTAILAFGAAILFAAGIRKSGSRRLRLARLWLALGFFLFAMEEISWGQRILGWTTPAALSALNYQGETNIHNFFNPLIPAAYAVMNAALAAMMFSAAKLRKAAARVRGEGDLALLLPGAEAEFLGCVFLALVYHGAFVSSELTEIIIAVVGISLALKPKNAA